jgi:hypothetical protein
MRSISSTRRFGVLGDDLAITSFSFIKVIHAAVPVVFRNRGNHIRGARSGSMMLPTFPRFQRSGDATALLPSLGPQKG